MNAEYQWAVGRFVKREVLYNVSYLISELAKQNEDYWHLFRKFDADTARNLVLHATTEHPDNKALIEGLDVDEPHDLNGALDTLSLDRADAEVDVYEHWLVTDWLAAKLQKKGETIEWDFYGLTVWARCCTGQAILLDRVIRDIYDDTNSVSALERILSYYLARRLPHINNGATSQIRANTTRLCSSQSRSPS